MKKNIILGVGFFVVGLFCLYRAAGYSQSMWLFNSSDVVLEFIAFGAGVCFITVAIDYFWLGKGQFLRKITSKDIGVSSVSASVLLFHGAYKAEQYNLFNTGKAELYQFGLVVAALLLLFYGLSKLVRSSRKASVEQ